MTLFSTLTEGLPVAEGSDVDLIAAGGETFGQPFGELRGTIDFEDTSLPE